MYLELYCTSTCCGREYFRAWVKTRNSFPAHHGGRQLWPLPSPMAQRHSNQAHRRHPHTMGNAACARFGLNPPGGRVVSTPPPNTIMSFFFMHVVDYFVEYIHIFDTLLINYAPKFPPCLRSKRRCCCRPPPSPTTTTTLPSCRRRRRYSAAKTKALD
jgi:hypothetical protein